MNSENSVIRQLIKIIALLIFGIIFIVIYMLYMPKEERVFLRQISNEFQERPVKISPYEKVIKINSIFNFNWDKVCLITEGMYLNFQGDKDAVNRDLLGKNYLESAIKNIDTNNAKFKSGFVFQDDDKPVKVFKFSKLDTLKVDEERYSLVYIDWAKKEYFSSTKEHKALPCFSRENAILRIDSHSRKLLLGAK